MFKNGRAAVVTMESETRISKSEMIDVVGITEEVNLEIGYFIKVGNDALFINNEYVIRMKDQKASVIEGYLGHDQFESVIGIDDGYFVVMDQEEGIIVYQYDGEKVSNVSTFGAAFLNPTTSTLQLEDITYHSSQQILIVLDYYMGAQAYKISKEENFTLTPASSISNEKFCHIMYLHSNNLYVSCRQMLRYNLESFPKIQETKLPFPNVEIKEIYEIDNIVAFVGRNSFSILYLNRIVNYYEDGKLDRLIFFKDNFISASEAGIDIGKVNIIKPYVTCSTDTEEYLGVTKLVFKTIAECNSSYFEKYQINTTSIGNFEEGDVCIYTVYRSASYWKIGEINVLPFIGVSLAILFILFLLVIVFCFKNIKIQRVQSLLDEFASSTNSESAKHQQFEDEMEGGQGVVESEKDMKPNMDGDLKGNDVPQHMHDIS